MEKKIYFTKVRDVKSPTRATDYAAGIDFYIPTLDEKFWEDFKSKNPDYDKLSYQSIIIEPGKRVLIPSGIKVWMKPKESALIAANKSGLASKDGLTFTAEVVDSDYTGEVHIGLLNNSNKVKLFQSGDKAIQFVHTPVIFSNLEEVDNLDYSNLQYEDDPNGSARGEGGFGSTGK